MLHTILGDKPLRVNEELAACGVSEGVMPKLQSQ